MFVVNQFRDMLVVKMSTDPQLIERAVVSLEVFLEKVGIQSHSGTRTVVRELLDNAIEHGNRGRADKEIHFEVLHKGGNHLNVSVEDEGEGFDWASVATHLPLDPNQERKRGYPLIKTITDEFDFNKKGNRVLAHITIAEEADLSVSRHEDLTVLHPSGNLTHVIAGRLRVLLLELLARDCLRIRFDLSAVKDIDSVVITVLVVFAKMCAAKDRKISLEICGANEDISNLFRLTRLDETYPLIKVA